MSSYQQIRRARKAGLQQIMVIDSPFPVPARVLLDRLAWWYRSEAEPVVTAGMVLAAGWWLQHRPPRRVCVANRRWPCTPPPSWSQSWRCSLRSRRRHCESRAQARLSCR
jgi:hypothetical protein